MQHKFKAFLFIISTAASLPSIADFQAFQIAPCSFWMPGPGSGYVCQNIPKTIVVPNAHSIAKTINEQSKRISELEKKIAEIEAKIKNP